MDCLKRGDVLSVESQKCSRSTDLAGSVTTVGNKCVNVERASYWLSPGDGGYVHLGECRADAGTSWRNRGCPGRSSHGCV